MAGFSVSTIVPMLEGMVGTMPLTAQQPVSDWARVCKQILYADVNRSATDWQFHGLSGIIQTGAGQTNAAPMTTGSKLYALLIGTLTENVDGGEWVTCVDGDTNTFDGTAALNNSVVAVLKIGAVAVSGVEEFRSVVWPDGITLATGLTINADGIDGTNPGASVNRGWILYRAGN